jgi:uncharacterized protein
MSGSPDVSTYAAGCPLEVTRPVMVHRWATLTFLHWAYRRDVVQRLVPPSLTVETFDGRAWVGLVPFMMHVRAPGVPELPWLSAFCETNVRTYVRDAHGRPGVWFFSLDAARLPAVVTARLGFALPYYWSTMSLRDDTDGGATIRYRCRRRWPQPRGVRSDVTVEVGSAYSAEQLSDLDHFLTARWRLFSVRGTAGSRRYANAQHDPWPLHRATIRQLDDELVAAAGLPAPAGDPFVHYSPGVEVRIGIPHRIG